MFLSRVGLCSHIKITIFTKRRQQERNGFIGQTRADIPLPEKTAHHLVPVKNGGFADSSCGGYGGIQGIDLGEIFRPDRIAQWLSEAGPLAPVVFMGLMALAVVIGPIPSLPLDIAAGAAFGPLLGATYAVIGAEIGAITSFFIGRALGREV